MYGIYANIGGILMVNVTIYSIYGSYGYMIEGSGNQECNGISVFFLRWRCCGGSMYDWDQGWDMCNDPWKSATWSSCVPDWNRTDWNSRPKSTLKYRLMKKVKARIAWGKSILQRCTWFELLGHTKLWPNAWRLLSVMFCAWQHCCSAPINWVLARCSLGH